MVGQFTQLGAVFWGPEASTARVSEQLAARFSVEFRGVDFAYAGRPIVAGIRPSSPGRSRVRLTHLTHRNRGSRRIRADSVLWRAHPDELGRDGAAEALLQPGLAASRR